MIWKPTTPGSGRSRASMRPFRAFPVSLIAVAQALLCGCGQPATHAPATQTRDTPTPPYAAFPLHVEAGKRHLIDANGQPFFIQGDTPWDLIAQLSREDVDLYLEDRRAKGFNTILVELMEHKFSANPPKNVYGDPPFTVPGDFSTPNEAYFAHAEYVIAKAASKGMLVMITPAYMGYRGGNEGWYKEMVANGATKLRTYGQYVATRFRAERNILWVEGGDYNPPEKSLLRAVADGIRDVDPSQLQTFHGARQTSALGFLGVSEQWLNVNDIYTSGATVVDNALLEYERSLMPFFLIEAHYENEHGAGEALVRTQAYQAVLAGACGHLMGNKPVWGFFSGWQAALNSGGARTLVHLHTLIDSLPWWTLTPDVSNAFMTAGAGSGSRAVAAIANNGNFAVVYTPSVRFLACDLSHLQGPKVRARWYDPTSGLYTSIAGSPFKPNVKRVFAPPGNNRRGFQDWVLLLESTH